MLKSLIESLKWQDELASHTKKLIMYPAFVGTIVLGVTFFLMIYLVPQMAGFIKNMGQELPMQTKRAAGHLGLLRQLLVSRSGLPVIIAVAISCAVDTNPASRYRFDDFKLALPVIGPILRKIILSRFASVFAMMYASGITMIDSIRATEDVVGNLVIEDGLEARRPADRRGPERHRGLPERRPVSAPGDPHAARRRKHRRLDTALLNVSYFYNRDVKESIEKVQAMIEPAMTIILGVILGWVMLSVLGPIYDVITKLKI